MSRKPRGLAQRSFNPWYVGGGVKRSPYGMLSPTHQRVSILGMLEGVLKATAFTSEEEGGKGFNPWYVGGGVKREVEIDPKTQAAMFQSLVCWRGC